MAPAVLALLQFAPKILDLFGSRGEKVSDVAETVGAIAQSITGTGSVNDSVAALKADPQLAYQFELAVMEDKTILERLDEQSRQRASDQYKTTHVMADKIAWRIMVWNLPIIAALALINIVAVYFMKDFGSILAVVSNLIGVVIGALITERQQVTGFHFGSSLGSKIKDALKTK